LKHPLVLFYGRLHWEMAEIEPKALTESGSLTASNRRIRLPKKNEIMTNLAAWVVYHAGIIEKYL